MFIIPRIIITAIYRFPYSHHHLKEKGVKNAWQVEIFLYTGMRLRWQERDSSARNLFGPTIALRMWTMPRLQEIWKGITLRQGGKREGEEWKETGVVRMDMSCHENTRPTPTKYIPDGVSRSGVRTYAWVYECLCVRVCMSALSHNGFCIMLNITVT